MQSVSHIATDSTVSPNAQESSSYTHLSNPSSDSVLLGTAYVNIPTIYGDLISFRALIDPGSQVSFITSKAAQQLQLKTMPTNTKIFGIGQTYSGTSTKCVHVNLQSTVDPSFSLTIQCLTIPQITGTLPYASDTVTNMPHLRNLQLGDPTYHRGSLSRLTSQRRGIWENLTTCSSKGSSR